MTTYLYRLGRWSFRRRGRTTLLWVGILLLVFFGASQASDAPQDSSSMPGIESQQAFDLISQRFPGTEANSADAHIVFVARDGQRITSTANRVAIDDLVTDLRDSPQVADVQNPFDAGAVSKDGSTAFATVTYDATEDDVSEASKQELTHAVQTARDTGLSVEVGGSSAASTGSDGFGEIIGVGVAAIVLLITFGALAAAGLPLLTAIGGVTISLSAITALASTFGLSDTSGELAMMIGLAGPTRHTRELVSTPSPWVRLCS